jgi:hypothetical protein
LLALASSYDYYEARELKNFIHAQIKIEEGKAFWPFPKGKKIASCEAI